MCHVIRHTQFCSSAPPYQRAMVDRPAYRFGVGYTKRNYSPHFFYNPYYLPNQTKATVYFSTPTYGETPTSPSANLSGGRNVDSIIILLSRMLRYLCL